jgi:hypothetical protein
MTAPAQTRRWRAMSRILSSDRIMRSIVIVIVLLVAGLLVPKFPHASIARASPVPVPPRWAVAAGSRVLQLDRSGTGRVVVALGDPRTARHIAVVVPGVGNSLGTFDDPLHPERRPYGMAMALRDAVGPKDSAARDSTAVIAWLGYRTPTLLSTESATGDLARPGAARLAAFVQRLRATGAPGVDISVICHSYGTVVCGLAAPKLPMNRLVLLGSPGVRANSVRSLHTRAAVYAATARSDWIRWVPHVRIGDFGHGPDPTQRSFGAASLPTAEVSGHDGYFAPGATTLRAIAALISQNPRG